MYTCERGPHSTSTLHKTRWSAIICHQSGTSSKQRTSVNVYLCVPKQEHARQNVHDRVKDESVEE